ncbi:MAG: phosphatidate cytidylyltransferase [Dermatophilaceae bacterium]
MTDPANPATTASGPADEPPVEASSSGRNLPAAVGVGLLLAGVVVSTLLLDARAFLVVVIGAVASGAVELRRALANRGTVIPVVPLLLGTVGMLGSAYLRGAEALMLTFGLTLVGLLVWRVADGLDGAARDLASSAFVVFYPVFLAGFAALMLASPDGRQRVATFIVVAAFSDIGGYAVGASLGRHPMAPSLSPKKSWEGFAGSVLTCAVVGAITVPHLLGGAWWVGVLLGVVTAMTATLGDLVESSIKRDLGVKDMGTLLPGHGGLMDRLDSLVVVAPFAYVLLLVFVPV